MDGERLGPRTEANLRECVEVHDSMYKYFWYMLSEVEL